MRAIFLVKSKCHKVNKTLEHGLSFVEWTSVLYMIKLGVNNHKMYLKSNVHINGSFTYFDWPERVDIPLKISSNFFRRFLIIRNIEAKHSNICASSFQIIYG